MDGADLPAKCERRTSAFAAVDPTTDALVVVGGWRVRGDLLDPDPAINNGHFDEEVGTMQMLQSDRQAWTDLPPMPSAVSNFVGSVIGTKLYVAGGLRWVNGWRIASDELQIFDFETRTWSLGPDLPGPRYYGAGCVCGPADFRCRWQGRHTEFDADCDRVQSGIACRVEPGHIVTRVFGTIACCNYKNKLLVFGGGGDEEAFPPLVLSSITGAGTFRPPEEQFWLSEALKEQMRGRARARAGGGDEGFPRCRCRR